jgi:two-component SAPR family response regulator
VYFKKIGGEKKMKKVLFIDDDEHILKALYRVLDDNVETELHFKKCTDIEQACGVVDEVKPDLIFLDHNLSREMNGEGLEIAQYILEKHTNCQVISITSDRKYAEKYQKFGVKWIRKNEAKKIQEKIDQLT